MKTETKGICGFQNLGNTCYLNSVLQCLLHTKQFKNYILNTNFESNSLCAELKKLFVIIKAENCTISPLSFIKKLLSISSDIQILRQNDAHEFLIFLIDKIHEENKKKVKINISGKIINDKDKIAFKSMESWKKDFENNYSQIVDLFYGQTTTIISVDDELKSQSFTPISFFELSLENCDNIYDCLSKFCEVELLTGDNKWKCDKTNNYYDAKKMMKVWRYPKTLILSLKRFDNNQRKINKKIDFPLDDLDISDLCIGYKKKYNYELYGVINHIGSLNSGHYYSYCKVNKVWYKFNDTNISQLKESDILTNNAYILFYRLK